MLSCDCEGDDKATIACGLVLVTGLPASGKSSLVTGLQSTWHPADVVTTSPVAIHHVFQSDAFMKSVVDSVTDTSQAFAPTAWKSAQVALHVAVENALNTLVHSRAGDAPLGQISRDTVPLVVVEDNMHLRSMREFYWRLCRRVESNARVTESALKDVAVPTERRYLVAMLELRLSTSLGTCLQRNALRPARDAVPPYVLETMADTFEHCRVAPADARDLIEGCGPWQPLACAHPWPVFHLQDGPDVSSVVKGTRDLLVDRWASVARVQKTSVLRYWAYKCRESATPPGADVSCGNAGHLFDLQLRATVRRFFRAYGAVIPSPAQARVHSMKRACLQKRKTMFATPLRTHEDQSVAEQQLIVDFQYELLGLVRPVRAGDGV